MLPKWNLWKRLFCVLALVGTISLVDASAALAQRKGKNDYLLEEDSSKSYVLPYALVGLGVVLGLLLIARPGTREDKVKIRRHDEDEDLEA